jgi:hypothetical protein
MSHSNQTPTSSSEPLLFVGLVVGVVTALLAVLVEAGIELSPGLQTAVVGLVSALGALVVAIWGRSKVFSPATVQSLLAQTGAAATVATKADDTTVTADLPPNPPARPWGAT